MEFILQTTAVTKAVQDMLSKVYSAFPLFVSAVVILLVGYILSKIIAKLIRKMLEKIGIDQLGAQLNKIDVVHKANIDIKLSLLVAKFFYYFLMLFFMVAATSVLDIPEVSNLMADIFNFIPNLLVALIILVLGTLLADTLKNVVLTAMKSLGIPSAGLVANAFFYFLFINIVIVALSQAKINTAFLSQNISIIIGGIAAAFAIGYGLASKNTMANMLASFYGKSQLAVGDEVTVDDTRGVISKIDHSFVTIVHEGGKTIIPLNIALNQKIKFHN